MQISDENLHHARELTDDVFEQISYLNLIPSSKTSNTDFLETVWKF